MNDQTPEQAAPDDECAKKRAEIQARQDEFDKLWLKMSAGDTSDAARYRELRHILDDLRSDYKKTCGEMTETSSLPKSVLADWN